MLTRDYLNVWVYCGVALMVAVPTLISEKALHYDWIAKRVRPVFIFGYAVILLTTAGFAYYCLLPLSSNCFSDEFYSLKRVFTLWVLWPSVLFALLAVPSRYFVPYVVIGSLLAYAGRRPEPNHSIVIVFLLLAMWLEWLDWLEKDDPVCS